MELKILHARWHLCEGNAVHVWVCVRERGWLGGCAGGGGLGWVCRCECVHVCVCVLKHKRAPDLTHPFEQ